MLQFLLQEGMHLNNVIHLSICKNDDSLYEVVLWKGHMQKSLR